MAWRCCFVLLNLLSIKFVDEVRRQAWTVCVRVDDEPTHPPTDVVPLPGMISCSILAVTCRWMIGIWAMYMPGMPAWGGMVA